LPEQILSTDFYSHTQPDKVIIKLSETSDKKQYKPLNVKSNFKISIDDAKKCVIKLRNSQTLHNKTGSAHAAMLFDYKLNPIAFAEDVGRHNALDKVIGYRNWLGLMKGNLTIEFKKKGKIIKNLIYILFNIFLSFAVKRKRFRIVIRIYINSKRYSRFISLRIFMQNI